MSNVYVSSVAYAAVTAWTTGMTGDSTANGGRGTYVRATAPAAGSERVYRCTTSGTAGVSEPTWVTTKNATTADGATLIWTECTGQEADQVAGTLKAPHNKLSNAIAATWFAAGDTAFIGNNHVETAASLTYAVTSSLTTVSRVICIDAAVAHIPPTDADLSTGASFTASGGNLTLNQSSGAALYIDGLSLTASASVVIGSARGISVFKNCKFTVGSNNTLSVGGANQGQVYCINCVCKFSATNCYIYNNACEFIWRDTLSAIDVAGSIPTTLLYNSGTGASISVLEAIDLSACGSGKTLVSSGGVNLAQKVWLKDCKLGASVTISGAPANPYSEVNFSRCDSANTNYMNGRYTCFGTQLTNTAIVRTGGAALGATPYSWSVTTNANTAWPWPMQTFPLAINNATAAGTVNVTIEGIVDPRTKTTLPLNDEVWFDVECLGTSGYPLGVFTNGSKANALAVGASGATGQPEASTAAWDSKISTLTAPAGGTRQNSTAYSLGAPIAVANAPGQVWICTTAGTTDSSEPAGYTGAPDGTAVTDGTATFKAAVRFKQTLAITPKAEGYLYAYPKVALTSASSPIYIDPKITLS